MKRLGFATGMLLTVIFARTVSSEALPPTAVSPAMTQQEQRLASLLAKTNMLVLITPKLTDALAGNMVTLASRKKKVTVVIPSGGASTTSINRMKTAGVKIGLAPTPFKESALATHTFIATGGILQGKRGVNIITDGLVGEEMLMSIKPLLDRVRWY